MTDRLRWPLWLAGSSLLISACHSKTTSTASEDSGAPSPPNDTDDSGEGPADEWSVMATEVGQGVLLSAWSDGDIVRMVGGDLGEGPGVMMNYDGDTLCTESAVTDRALWWIHGTTEGQWTAVGESGTVLQENDGVRTRIDIPTEANLFGVWVTEESLVAVGGNIDTNKGEVWMYTDGTWTALAQDLPGVAFKVWEDWIVGDNILYQRSGTELIAHPGVGRLLTVRGRAADDIWAVGGLTSSLVMHFDGSGWSEVDTSGIGQPLTGIWTAPGQDVWITGNFGSTAYWDGSAWNQPEWPVTSEHFHAVWKHDDEVLFAGGNLFSAVDNYGTIARHGPGTITPEVHPCD